MSKAPNNSGFWEGGGSAYAAELKRQYNAKLADLQTRLNNCATEQEQADIRAEIAAAGQDYKHKLQDARQSLFCFC